MKNIGFWAIVALCLAARGEAVPQNLGSIRVTTPMYTAEGVDEIVSNVVAGIVADKITDGTNTIDAAGRVWKVTPSELVWTNATLGVATFQAQAEYALIWRGDNWGVDLSCDDGVIFGSYMMVSNEWSSGDTSLAGTSDDEFMASDGGVWLEYWYPLPDYGPAVCVRLPSVTNLVGRIALTNDIPDSVIIVAPSTNAAAGTAADAQATGTALYTGWTEWEFVDAPSGVLMASQPYYDEGEGAYTVYATYNGVNYVSASLGDPESTSLVFVFDMFQSGPTEITATRLLITPTKTSQLTNDSGFITQHQQLTPIYSDTPTFSEWVCSPAEVYGETAFVEEIDGNWILSIPSYPNLEMGPEVGAEDTHISFPVEVVTATRTRTDIIGYTLGAQTDMPLQPKGNYQGALSDAQVNAIDSVVDDRQTVAVFWNGTTNRLDLVGDLSGDDVMSIIDSTSLRIGSAVTSIMDGALYHFDGLRSVTIPDSVMRIGDNAFGDCYSLMSVTIPDSVRSIGSYVFSNCSSLTNVMTGNGVTSIGNYAFYSCSGLKSVTIGNSVISIGDNAFEYCDNLTRVTFKGKTLSEVSSINDYPWGISDTSIIKTENEATQEWAGDNFLAKTGGVVRGAVTIYGGFAQGCVGNSASGFCSHAEGTNTVASARFAHSEGFGTIASGVASKASGLYSKASGSLSIAIGANSNASNGYSFVWSGLETGVSGPFYASHGSSTFNINPQDGLAGVWIGETNLQNHIKAGMSSKADVSDLPYAMVAQGKWTFSGLPSGYEVTEFRWHDVAGETVGWYYEVHEIGDGYVSGVVAGAKSDMSVAVSISLIGVSFTATRSSLPGHLFDRANNIVTAPETMVLTFPPPIPNKSRDFKVRLVISDPITSPNKITFVGAPTNGVQESISFETENGTFPTLNTISTNILHFTETAPSLFYISNKIAIPTPAP